MATWNPHQSLVVFAEFQLTLFCVFTQNRHDYRYGYMTFRYITLNIMDKSSINGKPRMAVMAGMATGNWQKDLYFSGVLIKLWWCPIPAKPQWTDLRSHKYWRWRSSSIFPSVSQFVVFHCIELQVSMKVKCQRCFPHFPGCKELEINAIAFMHYCCHIEHYINFTRTDIKK